MRMLCGRPEPFDEISPEPRRRVLGQFCAKDGHSTATPPDQPSRNQAVGDHLKEHTANFWRCIGRAPARAAEPLQIPTDSVLEVFLEAVPSACIGCEWQQLFARPDEQDGPVDISLAMPDHTRHQAQFLEFRQPTFIDAVIKPTFGAVNGNQKELARFARLPSKPTLDRHPLAAHVGLARFHPDVMQSATTARKIGRSSSPRPSRRSFQHRCPLSRCSRKL